MLTKEKIIESINALPDSFTIDEVLERLILLHKIETGLLQVEEGKTMSTDELKKKLKRWQK